MISVIVPCYNSTHMLNCLIEETRTVFAEIGVTEYEFVLVNDCSPNPESCERILKLGKENSDIKVIDLAKNTGQANAQLTALNYAEGDIIVNMDDDMQTHPKNIPVLLDKLKEGYDLVLGKYKKKKHSAFRNLLTKMDNIFEHIVMGKPKDLDFTSFWVTRKYIRDELINYTHPYAFMEGLFLRTAGKIANVEIEHFERSEGQSGYNLKKLIKLWSNFTNFTVFPLRIAGILGILFSFIGFISAFVVGIRKLMDPSMVAGYASIICFMMIFFGVVLLFMGVIGEYVGRIFMCINSAPQYVIKRTINIDRKGEGFEHGTEIDDSGLNG